MGTLRTQFRPRQGLGRSHLHIEHSPKRDYRQRSLEEWASLNLARPTSPATVVAAIVAAVTAVATEVARPPTGAVAKATEATALPAKVVAGATKVVAGAVGQAI